MSVKYRFEVFGTVQKVFFRKHTQEKGSSLGLNGWCQNTSEGTVIGEFEGDQDSCDTMLYWLQKTGSPKSIISKVDYKLLPPSSTPQPSGFFVDRSRDRRF